MATTMAMTIDDEWKNFISPDYDETQSDDIDNEIISNLDLDLSEAPKATDIYISTKSKIAYLNRAVNLKDVFWSVPVIPYAKPANGVIKKQMKFNSLLQEELDIITENLKKETYFEEQIITSINNPNGRIKFKDIRKVSIGISKKDIMSYRCKQKSAFYNISTVVSIENLALTLPLAGPVAFPSSAAVSIPHPLQTVIKSRTSQKGVFRISGTLVKATPPKKKCWMDLCRAPHLKIKIN